jgi:hypothetical protein
VPLDGTRRLVSAASIAGRREARQTHEGLDSVAINQGALKNRHVVVSALLLAGTMSSSTSVSRGLGSLTADKYAAQTEA